MPAIQNLVLTDRATTPVNHTFVPRGIPGGVATVVSSNGTSVADKLFTISTRRANGKVKVRLVLRVPVVQTETINGISKPKVVRESISDTTFTFSAESTQQERDDHVGMFMSALDPSKALVNGATVDLMDIY